MYMYLMGQRKTGDTKVKLIEQIPLYMPNIHTATCRQRQVPRRSRNASVRMVAHKDEVGVALVNGHCPRTLSRVSLEGEDSVRNQGRRLTHFNVRI